MSTYDASKIHETVTPVTIPAGRGFAEPVAAIGEWVTGIMARFERPLVVALAAAFALAAMFHAAFDPMWFDELLTFNISRQPAFHDVLGAMKGDWQPPLQYALTRLFFSLFGENELAARLQAVLAFTAAGVFAYVAIRRRRPSVYAFLGLVMLETGGMHDHAWSARPYALMLMFTGLAFLCWQTAASREERRGWALAGVTLGIAGAVCSHFYGILSVGAFLAFGEIARLVKRRRFDWAMYAAIAVGATAIIPILPLAHAAREMIGNYVKNASAFWAKPRIADLGDYRFMLSIWLVAILAALSIALLPALRRRGMDAPPRREDALPAHEVAAALGLALLLPFVLLLTAVQTGYFLPRYAIGTAFGLAVLCGWALPAIGQRKDFLGPAAALSIVLVASFTLAIQGYWTVRTVMTRPKPIDPMLVSDSSGEPIVVASALHYVQLWWYAPPELRRRLQYLGDIPYATSQRDFLPELTLTADQGYMPMPVTPYREFLARHTRFLLYLTGFPNLEWTPLRLGAEGWRMELIRQSRFGKLYQIEAPG